ncbi:uncharacterized protein LOC112349043 [Selaginella moellendorffii]|uniref:uncharacterized protein LOC112349043 n=1 Tax=Selaginella moellendorffii TaxID=88036 RepID=UPI000D1C3D0E|nr:uncharacterized protein LOC112349043 [Selaginella moellendorffii]|eukprot:XP_024538400.1 uncharacterized protein LOC112349043 [Selaginella moellendorffii]
MDSGGEVRETRVFVFLCAAESCHLNPSELSIRLHRDEAKSSKASSRPRTKGSRLGCRSCPRFAEEQDCQDLITQEEEELYIDRHLPRAQADEIVCEISQVLPQSYQWLGLEEMDSKEEVFRVINWDVEVRSKSSAVLAHGSDAVLGIEVVSGLSRQGLNRCEMEFYLWARFCSW